MTAANGSVGQAAVDAGFVLVDKPGGWTSHDVVAKIRKLARMKKVGHGGTLDPMATGLLVVAVGRATRLLRFVQDLPKEYVATARFGVATDSLDADGAILERSPLPVTPEDLDAVARRFTGPIMQVPPMVSALKVGGRRLYELAREGQEVEREARPVEIYELEIIDLAPSDYPEVTFRVRCSKGTYVRTLADDMARALGGRAHLVALRRTAIGSLTVEEAHGIEEVTDLAEQGRFADAVLPPAEGLRDLPAVAVDDDVATAVRHGATVARHALDVDRVGPVRMLDRDGKLLAVYRVTETAARPEVVLS